MPTTTDTPNSAGANPGPPPSGTESDIGASETGRIEAFSDGVFAIAVTLLVLDLKVPPLSPHASGLGARLLEQWPSYLALVISFSFIGVMWVNHHQLFNIIQRSDHGLLLLNGLVLLGVTLVPFPTSLLAGYLGTPDAGIAAMVYNGMYVLVAVFFNLLWRYASYKNRLLDPRTDPAAIRRINRSYAFGPVLYLAALGLAAVSVGWSLAMNIALGIFFALPPRRQAQFALTPGATR